MWIANLKTALLFFAISWFGLTEVGAAIANFGLESIIGIPVYLLIVLAPSIFVFSIINFSIYKSGYLGDDFKWSLFATAFSLTLFSIIAAFYCGRTLFLPHIVTSGAHICWWI